MSARTALLSTAAAWVLAVAGVWAGDGQPGVGASPPTPLDLANDAFYNGRYEDAAARALDRRLDAPDDLAAYELRTSALLFQLKRLLGDDKKKRQELGTCGTCQDLLVAFQRDTAAAQALARARLQADASDAATLFFLGKIDLNHVWLHLGPLGRRTGWREYHEARDSLEAVLAGDPDHVRARVARAWIDYIVDTRMPWGTKWLFGGGSRTRALVAVREAAGADGDFYARAEARFALWEMLIREQDFEAATSVARSLAMDFPENGELTKFIEARGSATGPL
jgi:hypothetical protein